MVVGFTTFFDNFLTIMVLLFAWALVIVAFFILAVQMFVCILEFKLTTLAGFILVPFALWNRTSFLAERVLGNVVSSGVKVMVLAVIVGIGSNFFAEFTNALHAQEPDIGQAMSLVLASLSLFGLGIFGPAIASGLVSGWKKPQPEADRRHSARSTSRTLRRRRPAAGRPAARRHGRAPCAPSSPAAIGASSRSTPLAKAIPVAHPPCPTSRKGTTEPCSSSAACSDTAARPLPKPLTSEPASSGTSGSARRGFRRATGG